MRSAGRTARSGELRNPQKLWGVERKNGMQQHWIG
jgi:hypothetical protein